MTEHDDTILKSFKNGFMTEILKRTLVDKKVSDYSGRKRINITNSDGLVKDDAVVVLRKTDYDNLIKEFNRLHEMEKNMNNQKVTAEDMGEKFIEPLKTSYDDIINGLKADLKDKDHKINKLKAIYHDYDKQVYTMGFLDILRHKNREISDDFNSKIWILSDDPAVTGTELRKLNEPDVSIGDNCRINNNDAGDDGL